MEMAQYHTTDLEKESKKQKRESRNSTTDTEYNMTAPRSCIDCRNHRVESDRDPSDWFCDDDKCVLCTLKSKTPNPGSTWLSDRYAHMAATVSCRPYNLRKETTPLPEWCPLR